MQKILDSKPEGEYPGDLKIAKRMIKKISVRMWTGFKHLRIRYRGRLLRAW